MLNRAEACAHALVALGEQLIALALARLRAVVLVGQVVTVVRLQLLQVALALPGQLQHLPLVRQLSRLLRRQLCASALSQPPGVQTCHSHLA